MKRVWVVGYRENIFCWMEDVRFHDSFGGAFEALKAEVVGFNRTYEQNAARRGQYDKE